MDTTVITDDDRQTPSNEKSSSDDSSSVTTEILLPAYENDQRRMSSMSNIRVCPVKVNTRNSLPNFKIKHPYRQDDNENDQFNEEKKMIIDEHVKVSRIKRSSLRSLETEISHLRLDASSRRKSTGTVSVSRASRSVSQSVIGNITNREATQMASRLSTVRVTRTPTAASITQQSDQNVVASKAIIKRVSLSSGLPFKINQNKSNVTVKHVSVNPKKSS